MSIGFQSQFMSKLKEKEEKNVGITNNIKNLKKGPPSEIFDNHEETQNIISEKLLQYKEPCEVSNNQFKNTNKDSTFNISQTQIHDSKLALIKGGGVKNNVFEILNKPKNEASSNKGKLHFLKTIYKFLIRLYSTFYRRKQKLLKYRFY